MAGKMLDGTATQWDLRAIRAYADGVQARYASASPTNPHTSGTPEYTAWAAGVTDAEADTVDACVVHPVFAGLPS